jgi:uncharacterized protein YndB with AHSA1/START domain
VIDPLRQLHPIRRGSDFFTLPRVIADGLCRPVPMIFVGMAGLHIRRRHGGAVQEEMMPNSVQFHRVLRTTPDRLYRAFLDPEAMVKWLPPHGFTGKMHSMDPRVGGRYKMSFTNFTSGKSHSFGGEYLELVPGQRLRWTDRFDDPSLPGEMTVTVSLKKVSVGTEVNIVQEGIPDVIPAEACSLGWQESLTLLANLVEAEIPD